MASYDAAQQNTDAAKRGALAALAQGGSAGLDAYNQAISQTNAGRQTALNQAAQRSSLVGGPEADVANYSAPINAAGNEAVQGLTANRNALGAYNSAMQNANASYFDKVNAATPIEELAQLRALSNKGGAKAKTSGTAFENKVIGSALHGISDTQAQNAEIVKQNKAATVAANAKHKQGVQFYNGQLQAQNNSIASNSAELKSAIAAQKAGDNSPAAKARVAEALKRINEGTAAKPKINQLLQEADKAPIEKGALKKQAKVADPFAAARQEAVNQGMDPDEAAITFSRQNPTVAKKLVTNSPAYVNSEKSLTTDIRNGVDRTTILKRLNAVAQSHPLTAQYLLAKYKSQLPGASIEEKIASGQVQTYAEKKKLGLVK